MASWAWSSSNGAEVEISPAKFEIKEGDQLVASRTALPLRLAYALSIHKSQGMTLDLLDVDLQSTFAEGQVYVALSRMRSLQGLRVRGFHPALVKVSHKVREFYDKLN